jgi:hypothetical protein
MYENLAWNLDNFNFWYDGYDQNKFSKFSNDEYNLKFNNILQNDTINSLNLDILTEKFNELISERISFQFLIDAEIDVISREIDTFKVDVFDFFDEYSEKLSLSFINVLDTIEQYNDTDSGIFITVNGEILYVLLPTGETVAYTSEEFGYPSSTDIILTQEQLDTGEADFCSTTEIILEGGEYVFC